MFALIHNNEIQVGPRSWNIGFFSEYLLENDRGHEIDLLSRQPPTAIIQGSDWQIVPVRIDSMPSSDPIYDALVGPVWDVRSNEIVGSYTVRDAALSVVKNHLLSLAKSNRYHKETTDIPYEIDDITILLPMDRISRNIILTGLPGQWKFKQIELITRTRPNNVTTTEQVILGDVWINLNNDEFVDIQQRIREYVQECFNWEARITTDINLATTVDMLRSIDMTVTLSID